MKAKDTMPATPESATRIVLQDLPDRRLRTTDGTLERVLQRINGQEGDSCARDCDCATGLVCREGLCVSDW